MTEENQIKSRLQQTLAEVAGQTDITDPGEDADVAVLPAGGSPSDGSGLRRWARASLAAAAVLALILGGLAYAGSDGSGTVETAGNGAGASGRSGLPRYLPDWLPDGYELASFTESGAPRSSTLVWVNAGGNQLRLEMSDPPAVPTPGNANTTLSVPAANAPDTPVCSPEPCSSGQGGAAIPGAPAAPQTGSESLTVAVGDIEATVDSNNDEGTALIWEQDGLQFRLRSTAIFAEDGTRLPLHSGDPGELTPYEPDGDPATGSEATSGSVSGQAPPFPAFIGDEPTATSTSSTIPAPLVPDEVEVVVDPPPVDPSIPVATIDFSGVIDPSLPSTTAGPLRLGDLVPIAESLRRVSEDEFQAYVADVTEPTGTPPVPETALPELPEDDSLPVTTTTVPPITAADDLSDPTTGPTTTVPPTTLPLTQPDLVCMFVRSVVSPDLDERVDPQPALDLYPAQIEDVLAVDNPGLAEDLTAYRDGVLELIAASPDGLVSRVDLIELAREINDC